jgi:hypothetical protein
VTRIYDVGSWRRSCCFLTSEAITKAAKQIEEEVVVPVALTRDTIEREQAVSTWYHLPSPGGLRRSC